MEKIVSTLDEAMCILWILTYFFTLLGTIKCKFLLIHPLTVAIIAPFEFAVVINWTIHNVSMNYAFIAYISWAVLELVFVVLILVKYITEHKKKWLYFACVCVMTIIMCYFVIVQKKMFFFSYFNTFIGELFWFNHILKKNYPKHQIVLIPFITKFIADLIAVPVYLERGIWIIRLICTLLPILDFAFIVVWIRKHNQKKNETPITK